MLVSRFFLKEGLKCNGFVFANVSSTAHFFILAMSLRLKNVPDRILLYSTGWMGCFLLPDGGSLSKIIKSLEFGINFMAKAKTKEAERRQVEAGKENLRRWHEETGNQCTQALVHGA